MKVLLLSDIHGNSDALGAVLSEAERYSPGEVWFLGDLGGYGPETDKCFNRLMSYNVFLLPGNHDLYYAGRLSGDAFSDEALRALILSGGSVSREYIEVMKILPLFQKRKGISMVHGSLLNPETEYILYVDNAVSNFRKLKGKCGLFGHTHCQGSFCEDGTEVFWKKGENEQKISYRKNRLLINPGSVGQPRDSDPRAAWAVLDTVRKEVQFFRTPYNISSVQEKMRAIGSSQFLISRLERGI